jgi:hypothetical protein
MKSILLCFLISSYLTLNAQSQKVIHTESVLGMRAYYFEQLYPKLKGTSTTNESEIWYLLKDSSKSILFKFSTCGGISGTYWAFDRAQLIEADIAYALDDTKPALPQFQSILDSYIQFYGKEAHVQKEQSTTKYSWKWDDGCEIRLQYWGGNVSARIGIALSN